MAPLATLSRDPASGAIAEIGCLSSDGTDGRDGASGACTPASGLLGADGITVSPDGSAVFLTSGASGAVLAFARNPESGLLTRVGCLQYAPPTGSSCSGANVLSGAGSVIVGAQGKAMYVAASTPGAVSSLLASAVPGAGSVESIFSTPFPGRSLANPCIAVNGFDGGCGVGIATQGLDALALSGDGNQLYAVAPGSRAVDTFAVGPAGDLAESGCLKVEPPPGLCTGSKLMRSPTQLALSPDGRNVYVADNSAAGGGQVNALARDPAHGALTESSCVAFLPPPPPPKTKEEEEEGEENEEQPVPLGGPCEHVPGLSSASLVAVSGDGSALYAIGSSSLVVLARNQSTGALAQSSCASSDDSRCTSFPSLEEVVGGAVSPDGRNVYLATGRGNAVAAFGLGAEVRAGRVAASHAGTARVGLRCPQAMRRACTGHLQLVRALPARASRRLRHSRRHPARVSRFLAGRSRRFTVLPGHNAAVSVSLSPSARRLLMARHRLRLMAVVRADGSAGGSGDGRIVALRLGRF
jgi:DNA-binding beta-propeller fold protein YncE